MGGGSLKTTFYISGANENLELGRGVSVSLWILVSVWHQAGPSTCIKEEFSLPHPENLQRQQSHGKSEMILFGTGELDTGRF